VTLTFRAVSAADEPFLWEILTYAASMTEPDAVAVAQADAYLSGYVRGFGTRAGDWGLLALLDDAPVGAAWVRLDDGRPHAVATAAEPELALGAKPAIRGKGIGSQLLAKLLADAPFPAIVLSVRSTNPSVRLYQRHGFKEIRRVVNRVGGDSLVMRFG
jgi:ribosomal protein S18 acetylase RimI-like enzyme